MEHQLPEFVIAQALVRATRATPGIAGLYSGRFGEIATYGRGARVPGVRVHTEGGRVMVAVHIVATYIPTLRMPALADSVRQQLRQHLAALGIDNIGAIDVVVEDIEFNAAPNDTRAT